MSNHSPSKKKSTKSEISQQKFSITVDPKNSNNYRWIIEEFQKYLSLISLETHNYDLPKFLTSQEYYFNIVPPKYSLQVKKEQEWLRNQTSDDAYFMIKFDASIIIYSRSIRGSLFAIYRLLEEFGMIFFYPGQNHEFYSDPTNFISLESPIRASPAFHKRGVVLNSNLNNLLNWIDFAPKIGLNTIAINYYNKKIYDTAKIEADKRGVELEVRLNNLGKDFCNYIAESYLKAEEALLNSVHHCTSIDEKIYCFQEDGFLDKCKCNKYEKSGTLSTQLLNRLNMLIQNPLIPDSKSICYLAYLNSWKIPMNKPHPRVNLIMQPVHRCFNHALDDDFCNINKLLVKPQISKYTDIFQDSNEINQRIEISDYWFDSNLFSQSEFVSLGLKIRDNSGRLPICLNNLQKDIIYYQSLGISKIMMVASNLDSYYFNHIFSPQLCLFGKMLWNPLIKTEPLLEKISITLFGEKDYKSIMSVNEILDPKHFIMRSVDSYARIIRRRIDKVTSLVKKANSPFQKKVIRVYIKELEFLSKLRAKNAIVYVRAWMKIFYKKMRMLRS